MLVVPLQDPRILLHFFVLETYYSEFAPIQDTSNCLGVWSL